ncbi:ABC transporter ATP-binding protein [Ruminococcus sp. HUN007]|uniref:ABC transporter ATP-binding protein n=1 Tax=Ruminococcus sp. HUN007 TaxID=1514668 RepID=UPI0005D217B9|nr:ABC transporter ATP-binding protein [Ruminococcus sp. HUN007]
MIKTLLGCVREYKKATLLTPFFVSLEVVVECLLPMEIAALINRIQSGCDMGTIVKYGLILVLMAFVSLLFGVLSGNYCAEAGCGFAKNLRHDLYYKIQDFSFKNVDRFSSSSLVTRMTTDVNNLQMAYMMVTRVAVRCPFMLIFAFVMSVKLGGKLSLIFAVVIPLLGFALFKIISVVRPIFVSVFRKYDKLNESVQENIKGMRVVKSFVREEYEKKKFNAAAKEVCDDFTRAEKLIALNTPFMQLAIYTIIIFISFFCSKLIISENGAVIKIGTLSGMLVYSIQILISLMMVSMIFVMVTLSIEAANRVAEVLREESDITNPSSPVMNVPNGQVEFENVSFRYEKSSGYALENINLKIMTGQTIGIIGGTGSSKTTLVNLISRLYDVTKGRVLVGGHDVRDYDLETLRNAVSVVLQKNVLFSGTIKDNLRWGNPDATDTEIIAACRLAMADEFIERMPDRYDTYIEQGGTNVSGGQKQRLCIARAILKRPKVLILDDSTSAVDTRTDALLKQAFRTAIPNTTKIIIAQRISSVQDCDFIIVMDNGRIESFGTHEELLGKSMIYREVYESQVKGGSLNG